ncbi:MAG: efflux RND transporter periplasmic adaptor subunit [Aminobacteriaceae bacterium]|jgi:RND family efflux transporter MFP subunit|nr:efflux RND transporter periplasmic adaptor subunit [Synergistaceae bacterium]MDD3391137.1 efflux RND transporter periplasmic adaptor subunit [Synergistaceae bacterium]MDD4021320.1 efflux RND transporter periplasmic adaptor subunit [Synergistaceae bacterium]MDD4612729.1 efflux RND transporter periplasmic adaptor subunit [Synergistaceae bacterium]
MKRLWKTIFLLLGVFSLTGLFLYVMMRSGPLAPVPVTAAEVEKRSIAPALYGIGVVESGAVFRIGPTSPGRVKDVFVQVGDLVEAGQKIGVMDPVDLDQRTAAQRASISRLEAVVRAAGARTSETAAKKKYAEAQSKRYDNLLKAGAVSVDSAEAKRQERQVTASAWASSNADLQAARAELERARADLDALLSQKKNLDLVAPAPGLVSSRAAEPGTTVVAGQAVAEVIDIRDLRISVRFDQAMASGLRAGLPAEIVLRSRNGQVFSGTILRVEPIADPVTEELLAKAVFDAIPEVVPPLGELAEVTVTLPGLPDLPVVPDAALKRWNGSLGVWVIENGSIAFRPVKTGRRDLEGRVQIREGLKPGERVVAYSVKALTSKSRVKIYDTLEGIRQ